MLLEDIEKEWAADTIINPLKLTDESIKIPKLHAKYSTFINKERMVFIKLKLWTTRPYLVSVGRRPKGVIL